MEYSSRPSYLEIKCKGRLWAALYIIVDVSYLFGLIGGIGSCIYFLVAWPFDWLKQTSTSQTVLRPWSFYVYGFISALLVGACLFRLAIIVGRWMYKHLNIQNVE
jgi:hypothetical protein